MSGRGEGQRHQVPGDFDLAIRKVFETMPSQFSSAAQGVARGKRSEIDYRNGLIERRGAGLRRQAPRH